MKAIVTRDSIVKICARCQKVVVGTWREVLQAFHRNSLRADGLHCFCKECRKSRQLLGRAPKVVPE